jgi:hypothetical protein
MDNISAFLLGERESQMLRLNRSWDSIMKNVYERWELSDEEVRGLFGASCGVDEMALYFPGQDLLAYFIKRAVQSGWMLFNHVEDQVVTTPINSVYGVEYWFLRKEGVPYRLELMRVLDGYSPYHGSLQEACDECDFPVLLAHASFKVIDQMSYGSAVVALRNAGFELMQHCTSSYGKFSYMIDNERNTELPPIKPRINTRDGGEDSGN